MYGRCVVDMSFSEIDASLVARGHLSGLLMRHEWPRALMLCAHHVPIVFAGTTASAGAKTADNFAVPAKNSQLTTRIRGCCISPAYACHNLRKPRRSRSCSSFAWTTIPKAALLILS